MPSASGDMPFALPRSYSLFTISSKHSWSETPRIPTQETPTQPDDTTNLEAESLAQTFMQFTPLLYTHTPLIPLPDPTDLSDTGGVPGPGWGPGGARGRGAGGSGQSPEKFTIVRPEML